MQSKKILGAVLAASLMGFGAAAQAQFSAIVSIAPPAPLVEVVPAPRAGYVWAPGHYEWCGDQYVWVQGHWLTARSGFEYREPRWVQRANGDWLLVGNTWERRGPEGDRDRDGIANRDDRDRDGDGIPNWRDDRPNRHAYNKPNRNPYSPNADLDGDGIANRHDRDRDGDGVRNRRDDHPDNPRRD